MIVTMSGLNRREEQRKGARNCWFADWRVSGDKFAVHEDRAFGPVLFAQYTLSRGVLKLTAQIAPLDTSGENVG